LETYKNYGTETTDTKGKRINKSITVLAWILIISGITGMVSFYLFSRKMLPPTMHRSNNILLRFPVRFQGLSKP
jgi:hypothetical protein